MNEDRLKTRIYYLWSKTLDTSGVKQAASSAEIPKQTAINNLKNYRVEDQVSLILTFYGPTESAERGCFSTFFAIPGVLFLLTGISLITSEDYGYSAALILAGAIFIFVPISLHSSGRRKLVRGFSEIAMDYFKYANPSLRGEEPPSRYIADANDAEIAAAEFMRWLGFLDASATPIGPDGGIDIAASNAVGQVKDYGKPIGSPDIQQHLGVAIGEGGKLPIFFARSGYTTNALEFANENEMPLFQFDLAGSWKTSNLHAERLWNAGADIFLENRKETTGAASGIFSEFEEPGIQYEYDFSNESEESLEGFDDIYLEDLESDFTDPPKSLASELQELAALRDMGVLSEEEFLKAKKKLLD
jgi:hypothetical protein